MNDHKIKFLYGILGVGILISFFHIINNKNGSGLGNLIGTITITSLVLFTLTIVLIIFSFKKSIKDTSVWFLLIVSSPFAIISISHLTKELLLNFKKTTTPNEFVYSVKVDPKIYERDKIKIRNLIDSLIKIKIIERPAELALRYFNGKTYNDTIERNWAIDLSYGVKYKEIVIDTLFYSANGKDIVAGLLVGKALNRYINYPNGGVEFIGYGFKFDKNDLKPLIILKYSISHKNYKLCSNSLRYYYLKKIGTYNNKYNINDKRFLYK